MGGVGTSILRRPRPSPDPRRADPCYTLNCEEPVNGSACGDPACEACMPAGSPSRGSSTGMVAALCAGRGAGVTSAREEQQVTRDTSATTGSGWSVSAAAGPGDVGYGPADRTAEFTTIDLDEPHASSTSGQNHIEPAHLTTPLGPDGREPSLGPLDRAAQSRSTRPELFTRRGRVGSTAVARHAQMSFADEFRGLARSFPV